MFSSETLAELTTCLVSDEVNDVIQGEGGGAVPAGDQVGRLLFPLVGRAGLGSDAGGVWRLLWRTVTIPETFCCNATLSL